MQISTILSPAIAIMNKLPFKLKIFSVISILFILLILPSRTVFINFFEQNSLFEKQLIGLNYSQYFHSIIKLTQLHRGQTNAYLNGNSKFKTKIVENEKKINTLLLKFIDFDKDNFNLLKNNLHFVQAMSEFDILHLSNIKKDDVIAKKIFDNHSKIISNYIKTLKNISKYTLFETSTNLKVNFIAQLLQTKLLLLEDNIGKLRGILVGVFEKQQLTKEQKSEIISIYSIVKAVQRNILDDSILQDMDNYLVVQKKMIYAMDKTDKLLEVINKKILMSEDLIYDSSLFFKYATNVLEEQTQLYHLLSKSYVLLLDKLESKMYFELLIKFSGLLLILFSALYITMAFYRSITSSLKKLQVASTMIAEGKTKIYLESDTNDELGNALVAFNNMSSKLDENISFLDSYKMAVDETSIVSKTNPKGVITYVNQMFCDISGYKKSELIGMSHNIVRDPDTPRELFKDMWKTIKAKKVWKGVVNNVTKDGSIYTVDATIIPVLDSSGEVIEYIGIRHDITELERSKDKIKKQKIDFLTALPNRTQLLDDLPQTQNPVLLYMNIDDFSGLNDFYGTKTADNVLIHLSKLFQKVLSSIKDVKINLYKLQSDEFLFLIDDSKDMNINYSKLMEMIIDFVEAQTIECDSQSCVSITLSGGISRYSDGEYQNILSFATIARKFAKSQNKKFLVYDNSMNNDTDYQNNIEWINKIKDAIAQDRIVTYYQPIIDNKTGAITKYESLVRMIDTDQKVISPFFFLDISKKARLYSDITKIVLDKSFATFSKFPQYEFSMNLTIEDIEDKNTVSYIFDKLKNFSHPQKVIFEITESEEIKDYKVVNTFISAVKSYGAKIAIDDFGSGYANFEHIIGLKADFIKIDGSLIKNIDKDEDSRIVAEAIIAFSKKMGSKTVTEYVHSEKIYDIVRELGADFSQGFYLGKPSPKIISIKELVTV